MKLPVSVIICTLNEEKNMGGCIRSIKKNNPKEILIIDGGSKDETIDIIRTTRGVKLVQTKKGLAHQRQIGVNQARQKYIAFIDADDRLDKDCIKKLINDLLHNDYDAVQARTLSYAPRTYWQRAMGINLSMFISKPGKTIMVGRPALYKREVFNKVKFDERFTFASEDTDLSRQLEIAGFSQGIGTGKSYRKHLRTLRECVKQWMRYGKGDALFTYKYKNRIGKMFYHLLINYPLKKSWIVFKKREAKYIPFFVLQGLIRFTGFLPEYLRLQYFSGDNPHMRGKKVSR